MILSTTDNLPLVTVVIPTYNRRPLLEHAINSVVAQTYPHWELIVSDDGSTDSTVEWVRSLDDPRIKVVRRAHNGRLGYVRNFGVASGSGDLLAFLDSDDLWLSKKLEMQIEALRRSGAGWCFSGFEMMDEKARTIPFRAGGWQPKSGRIAREVLTTEVGVSISSLMVQRTLFDVVGRFNETILREDHELAMRLALRAEAVAVPEVLVRVREHPGRMSQVERSAELTAHIYGLFLEQSPPPELARLARRVRSRHLAEAGARRLAEGDYSAARTLLARALADGSGFRGWTRAVARGIRGQLRRGGAPG